jgi:hypothetical protein
MLNQGGGSVSVTCGNISTGYTDRHSGNISGKFDRPKETFPEAIQGGGRPKVGGGNISTTDTRAARSQSTVYKFVLPL